MNFIETSLSYKGEKTQHMYLVPEPKQLEAHLNSIDHTILGSIREKGFFNLSVPKPLDPIDLLKWQVKMITLVFVHYRRDINLTAYGPDHEKLVTLVAHLSTCGFANQISAYITKNTKGIKF